jgi:FdhD protein
MIGRAKGKRFLVLSGKERVVYDADARTVAEEARHLRRKGTEEDAA